MFSQPRSVDVPFGFLKLDRTVADFPQRAILEKQTDVL